MEDKKEQVVSEKTKKKHSTKQTVYLVIIALVVGLVIYTYFWVKNTNDLRNKAIEVVGEANQYQVLNTAIRDEQNRCKTLITQESGDFSSFEYCKKFIDWSGTVLGNK